MNLLPFEDTDGFVPVQTPAVTINGMAKANPTVDEVASEFRRGK